MQEDWVNNKYTIERIIFRVEVDISYRIKKHRTFLISSIRKQLKKLLNENNTNVIVAKKVSIVEV